MHFKTVSVRFWACETGLCVGYNWSVFPFPPLRKEHGNRGTHVGRIHYVCVCVCVCALPFLLCLEKEIGGGCSLLLLEALDSYSSLCGGVDGEEL